MLDLNKECTDIFVCLGEKVYVSKTPKIKTLLFFFLDKFAKQKQDCQFCYFSDLLFYQKSPVHAVLGSEGGDLQTNRQTHKHCNLSEFLKRKDTQRHVRAKASRICAKFHLLNAELAKQDFSYFPHNFTKLFHNFNVFHSNFSAQFCAKFYQDKF